jgi:hypothetical protein
MKSSGAVQKQAERASRDAEPVLEQPKQVERGQAQGDNTEDRVLEQPEQDVRGVAARKHMRGSRRAKDAAAHAVGREEEDGRDGQGSFKEAKMGRDITRPVVIRAVARDTLSGRPAQAVGCEGGGRVPGGYPVTKTMDTRKTDGTAGVVDEDGTEVDVCCGVRTSLWEDWDAVQMGGSATNASGS